MQSNLKKIGLDGKWESIKSAQKRKHWRVIIYCTRKGNSFGHMDGKIYLYVWMEKSIYMYVYVYPPQQNYYSSYIKGNNTIQQQCWAMYFE